MGSTASTLEAAAPQKLRLLSYNIYFGDESMSERTLGIMADIGRFRPDAVGLQEVTSFSEAIIKEEAEKLGYKYISSNTERKQSYFCGLLIAARCGVVKTWRHNYTKSTMDRHYLAATFNLPDCSIPITIATSHLESMQPNTRIRMDQLRETFRSLHSEAPAGAHIFLGDMNLEDGDLATDPSAIPPTVVDVWEALGRDSETEITWDMDSNDIFLYETRGVKRRYDRMYAAGYVTPTRLHLIGKERLPCGLFPSDHWGLVADFEVSGHATPSGKATLPLSPMLS
jgi:tyrosyl-DNA phosphodiesterase 2